MSGRRAETFTKRPQRLTLRGRLWGSDLLVCRFKSTTPYTSGSYPFESVQGVRAFGAFDAWRLVPKHLERCPVQRPMLFLCEQADKIRKLS